MEYEKIIDLKDMLLKSVQKYENKVLYKLPNKEITYKQMYNQVKCLGTELLQLGLKNKKIAIISENRYEWEISYFAITCGVGVVVPLDKSLSKTEIITILRRAEVEAIFCSEKYEKELLEIQKELETLKYIISFNNNSSENIILLYQLIKSGQQAIDLGNNEFEESKINPNELGFLMFTSGTTEKAKAVMLSHKNVCSNLVNVAQMFPITNADIALSVLPLNHVLEGLFCLLLIVYKGATRIYCNDLNNIIEDINKYKISFMGAVPAIYEYIYKRIDEIDKENINIFMSGGAQLNIEIEEKFRKKGINLVQGYGITETSPVVCMSNNEIYKLGSVGKVIPNVELNIINKEESNIGELIVKGENVFLGYYQDKDTTEKVLKNGWFYTGDLAKIDEQGYIFICGRNKNMIVLSNGKKVFPEEIESMINNIEGVKESLVYDRKISENKNGICAEIVIENIQEKEIILDKVKKLNNLLPKYKHINMINVTEEELLKTTTGKIKREELLEKINAQTDNKKESEISKPIYNEIKKTIQEIIIKQLGINQFEDYTTFIELGADSLDKVEIILAIEKKFNIKISKEESANINNLSDCVKIIKK